MGLGGAPASREVIEICAEKGLDVRSHHSSGISIEEIEASDFIFVMSRSHRDTVLELCPKAAGKCELLDGDREISDPIGAGDEVYRNCAKQIEKALDKRINEIIT
jgi:protein-tyrosine phosphatase